MNCQSTLIHLVQRTLLSQRDFLCSDMTEQPRLETSMVSENDCSHAREHSRAKSSTRRVYQKSSVPRWTCMGPIHVSPNVTT